MKKWFDTKYGKAPFDKVLFVEIEFSDLNNNEITSKQYALLLDEKVIQAHLDPFNKIGKIILETDTNPEQLLKKIGIDYKIHSKKTILYEEVLENNYLE